MAIPIDSNVTSTRTARQAARQAPIIEFRETALRDRYGRIERADVLRLPPSRATGTIVTCVALVLFVAILTLVWVVIDGV